MEKSFCRLSGDDIIERGYFCRPLRLDFHLTFRSPLRQYFANGVMFLSWLSIFEYQNLFIFKSARALPPYNFAQIFNAAFITSRDNITLNKWGGKNKK